LSEKDTLEGQVLHDTYLVEHLIGEGGMGAVYEASHLRLSRRLAVKVLSAKLAEFPEAMSRFRREAQITSKLGHPHIIEIIDFNETEEGAPYIIMELLEGEDLEIRLRRQSPLPLPLVGTIVAQTASALHAAHEEGIIHRDLKPSNIYLCRQGDYTDVVKVLDFGISKMQGAQSALTRAHTVIGTPWYMSPEQARGMSAEVDLRTDIFALGSILYEMVGGRPPFVGQTPDAVLYQVVHEAPPSLGGLRQGIPAELEQAVARAMAKDREDRFPGMRQFAEAVAAALEQDAVAPGPGKQGRPASAPPHVMLSDTEDQLSPDFQEEASVAVKITDREEDGPSTEPDTQPRTEGQEVVASTDQEHTIQGVGPKSPQPEVSVEEAGLLPDAEAGMLPEMPTLIKGEQHSLEEMATAIVNASPPAPSRTTLSRSSGEMRRARPRQQRRSWLIAGGAVVILALGFGLLVRLLDDGTGPSPVKRPIQPVTQPMAQLDGALHDSALSLDRQVSAGEAAPNTSAPLPPEGHADAAGPDSRRSAAASRIPRKRGGKARGQRQTPRPAAAPKPDARVRPRPRYGTLRVIVRIPGGRFVNADFYLNGRARGKTPMKIPRIRAGLHRIMVRFKGYKRATKRVRVRSGRDETIVMDLQR